MMYCFSATVFIVIFSSPVYAEAVSKPCGSAEPSDGSLPFVIMDNAVYLPGGEGVHEQVTSSYSNCYDDDDNIPFGNEDMAVDDIYVYTSGYISFEEVVYHTLPPIPISPPVMVVAPFALDYDTSNEAGDVKYICSESSNNDDLEDGVQRVSDFINKDVGNKEFKWKFVLAVEWDTVPRQGTKNNNTFQAILITDLIISYAVFIYKHGSMGQGGGNVGWQFNASMCASNKESGQPDNNKKLSTFCNNESCAIAYLLSDCVSSNENRIYFTCANMKCVGYKSRCDGHNDCGDNSDEDNCCGSNNIGLYLEVAAGFLFVGLIILCVFHSRVCL